MNKVIIFLIILGAGYPVLAQNDSTATEEATAKKEHRRTSDVKIYAGVTLSQIIESGIQYESASSIGFNLGVAFRQGRFAYWEAGLRYNGSIILLEAPSLGVEENVSIGQIEIPVLVGINLLSATRRVLGLRVFAGIAPGIIAGIGDNELDLDRDDFESFQFNGMLGAGVDIAAFFVEIGYERGFTNLLTDYDSNLSQGFLNIGLRF